MSSSPAGASGPPSPDRGRPYRLAFALLSLAALPAFLLPGLRLAAPATGAVGLAALAAALLGVRLHRPPAAGIWYLFGLSIALLATGMLLRTGSSHLTPAAAGGMPLGQAPILMAYAALLGACAWAGIRATRPEPGAALEMAILAVGLSAALWAWLYQPLVAAGAPWSTVLDPVFDSTLVVLAIHLVLSHRRVARALWLLLVALVATLAVAVYGAVLQMHGHGQSPPWLGAGWWLVAASIGFAALHPSMAEVAEPDRDGAPHLSWVRVLVLGAAMLAPGWITLASLWFGHALNVRDIFVPRILLTGLIFVRLKWLFDERNRWQDRVLESERRFRSLFARQKDHVLVVTAAGDISYESPSLARLGAKGQSLVGRALQTLFRPEERERVGSRLAEVAGSPGGAATFVARGAGALGPAGTFELTMTNLGDDPSVGGVAVTLHDVTERLRFEGQLRHQALHDPLTGLPNRARILEVAREHLTQAAGAGAAALFIDLDNFKEINDNLGHRAGDEVLVAVSGRLRQAAGPTAIVGRLGGDEFVVLPDPKLSEAEKVRFAERLLEALRSPFALQGRLYAVTASLGLATGPRAGPDELLRDADIAMYEAKGRGRNGYVVFAESMRKAAHERFELAADLQASVHAGQIGVAFQPVVALTDGRLLGAEALVRWNHPTRGPIDPEVFMALAQAHDLSADIDRHVLSTACACAAQWPEDLYVAVNLSLGAFDARSLVDDVALTLARSGLSAGRLVLELAEGVTVREPTAVASRIRALRALGPRVGLDDFGVHASSLDHLRQLPLDVMKLDRSFLRDLGQDAHAHAAAAALVSVGRAFGMTVVAEGVETAAQKEAVARLGCSAAQGFFFSPPLPAADFAALALAWRLRPATSGPA